jgi:hypothetical protein
VFSLNHETKHKVKSDNELSIGNKDDCYLTFGGGKNLFGDIDISNNCNRNSKSLSNLGCTYLLDHEMKYWSYESKHHLTGMFQF